MSLNTATGLLASQLASDEAAVIHRKAAEKCQIILETLYDSSNGYKQCADDCKDPTAKLLFQKIAERRVEYISQLASVIQVDLGVEPYVVSCFSRRKDLVAFPQGFDSSRIKSGSAIAAAHRAWIDVKSWFTDGRDKSVLITEIHRGEGFLIKFYESALNDPNILSKIRDLLQEQLQAIKEQNVSVDVI